MVIYASMLDTDAFFEGHRSVMTPLKMQRRNQVWEIQASWRNTNNRKKTTFQGLGLASSWSQLDFLLSKLFSFEILHSNKPCLKKIIGWSCFLSVLVANLKPLIGVETAPITSILAMKSNTCIEEQLVRNSLTLSNMKKCKVLYLLKLLFGWWGFPYICLTDCLQGWVGSFQISETFSEACGRLVKLLISSNLPCVWHSLFHLIYLLLFWHHHKQHFFTPGYLARGSWQLMRS